MLQKERAMKKSLCLFVVIGFFLSVRSLHSVQEKKVYMNHYKPSKHHKKSQLQSVHHNSLHQDTKKMLEDLYHRYPRKYSREQPKRIEQDDFQ